MFTMVAILLYTCWQWSFQNGFLNTLLWYDGEKRRSENVRVFNSRRISLVQPERKPLMNISKLYRHYFCTLFKVIFEEKSEEYSWTIYSLRTECEAQPHCTLESRKAIIIYLIWNSWSNSLKCLKKRRP